MYLNWIACHDSSFWDSNSVNFYLLYIFCTRQTGGNSYQINGDVHQCVDQLGIWVVVKEGDTWVFFVWVWWGMILVWPNAVVWDFAPEEILSILDLYLKKLNILNVNTTSHISLKHCIDWWVLGNRLFLFCIYFVKNSYGLCTVFIKNG